MRHFRMSVLLLFATTCATAFCLSATSASAGGSPIAGSQLLDVSGKVSSIQSNVSSLLADGKWAKLGPLSLLATCDYKASSQVFLPWADPFFYALAPQGDMSATDLWTLSRQTTAVIPDTIRSPALGRRS